MSSKNSFPIYIVLTAVIAFFAFKNTNLFGKNDNSNLAGVNVNSTKYSYAIVPNKYEKIIHNAILVLNELHYNPKKLDDAFSKQIFAQYLDNLDPTKDVLLQSDIEQLRVRFETKIDDELRSSIKAEFFSVAGDLYKKRLAEVKPYISSYLNQAFDYSSNENILVDGKKIPFPKNEIERRDYWRKKLKYMTLERYTDLLTQNETAKNKKTAAQLEKDAREKVLKIVTRNYEGMLRKATTDAYFNTFLNTVTQAYDPHTDYFAPVDQRSFNEEMSANYYGIGAQLKDIDGNIVIGPLTTNSPAQKSGEIAEGDILLAVAQGDGEPVDIAGFTTPECVKIIRGKQDTEVRLTLKKPDGSTKVVKLVRKKLNLDGTLAKSTVVQQGGQKIGVINLPEFYANFDDKDGKRCAKDVAEEIEKLKAEGVTGIIMDLRNNGGGSLFDVVQMVGFFIEDGPVVQVKDKTGQVMTQRDKDKSVLWTGPLTVMVNEFSASASEIFAAAIQDYGRGLVIGSTSTYGKGTVQRQIPLNFENNKLLDTDEYGSIKVTLQKFYRVNGGSTQLKGVTPDIVLPDMYEYLKYREKDNESALLWDEIPKASIKGFELADIENIKRNSIARVAKNPLFNAIKYNSLQLKTLLDKDYSLNLKTYKAEQATIKALNKKIEDYTKVRDSLPFTFLKVDEDKFLKTEGDKLENNKRFLNFISKDAYINETVKIMLDMLAAKPVALKN